MKPEQLKEPAALPDELKRLLAEIQVPATDPVLPLMAWIWRQMAETKSTLDVAKASVVAVLDDRLERMATTAKLLGAVDVTLHSVEEQLRAKPLKVKEQVEQELAVPIKAAVDSCHRLDQQIRSLLQRLDHKVGRTNKALNRALFAAGFTGGGILGLCLGHFLSAH